MIQPIRNSSTKRFPSARSVDIRSSICRVLLCGLVIACSSRRTASAQDWFKTGTGLGVSKARVAVADFAAKDTPSQPLATLFSDVVRTDLDFSGILELVSKSYNPLQTPRNSRGSRLSRHGPVRPHRRNCLPSEIFRSNGSNVEIQAWLNDVRDASLPPVIGKVYRGRGHRYRRCASSRISLRMKSSANFPADCRESPPRKSPSSAIAAATRKSGPWITTAKISIS